MKKQQKTCTLSRRLPAFLLALLMILGVMPIGAFAIVEGQESVDGKTYVTPLSEYNETAGFTGLSSYYQKTESYTTPSYEDYASLPTKVHVYYDATDGDGNGIVDSVETAFKLKDYHEFLNSAKTNHKRDVIVYAVNYVGERIGTEGDVAILSDYLKEGYIVLVVDFLKNPLAGTPNIEHAMAKIGAYYGGSQKVGVTVNASYFYYLPSGYRLARNVWFWNSYYYSSLGTQGTVTGGWNKCIVYGGKNNHNKEYKYTEDFTLYYTPEGSTAAVEKSYTSGSVITNTAEYIEDCVRKDGSPLRYDCYMDIIYPSIPNKTTGVYMMAATQPDRHDNTCSDERCTFVGMAFSGYTVAISDCVYVPMSRNEAYGYIDTYGVASQNVVKSAQAAVRCLRYYASTYGYDASLIGVGGISKASPTVAPLGIRDNERVAESNIHTADQNARTEYGVSEAYHGDIVTSEGTRLTLQQPFLYYEVPYGPIYNDDGSPKRDIYGNVLTHDYYGADGVEYMRSEADCDLRTPIGSRDTTDGKNLMKNDANFRTVTNKSIADYRPEAKIDMLRAVTADSFTGADGVALTLRRRYGTDDASKPIAVASSHHDSYYYYIDSDVAVSYASAGDGVNRFESKGTTGLGAFERVPMLICCGSFDPYGCFDHWYAIRDNFVEMATEPYFPITMMDQGHVYPTGYDYEHGYWRHDAFLQFFNHYLKPEEYNYADLIWMTPQSGNSYVDIDAKIELKFYDEVDMETVISGVVIEDAAGNPVSGTWTSSEVNTRFTFTPDAFLAPGTTYTVSIAEGGVKALDGEVSRKAYSTTFTTTSMNSFAEPIANAYTGSSSKDKAYHADKIYTKILKVDAGSAFVTFKKSDLIGKSHLQFEAVYQYEKSGVTFEVKLLDDYRVDAATLTYNTQPTWGTGLGTVTTDATGYGTLDISRLALSDETEYVTFGLFHKSGDIYFEALQSAERGVGIKAVAELEAVRPLADAYVSELAPNTCFGDADSMVISGKDGERAISYISFSTEELEGRLSAELKLPALTTLSGSFEVYQIDNYVIDETTLTYNTRPSLDSAKYLGSYKPSGSGDLSVLIADTAFAGEYVTFAVCSVDEVQIYHQGFDGNFEYDADCTNSFNESGDFRTGGEPGARKIITEAGTTNKIYEFKTNKSHGRVKFYNIWSSTRNLDESDIGKTYRISFRLKAAPDYTGTVGYGVMAVIGSSYIRSATITPTTEWQTATIDVTIEADFLTQTYTDEKTKETYPIPVTFAFDQGGTTKDAILYVDDIISVSPIGGSGTVASIENETESPGMLCSGKTAKQVTAPIFATQVDETAPTTAYGDLANIGITESISGIFTFDISSLKGKNELNLPIFGGKSVKIYQMATPVTEAISYNTYKTIALTPLGSVPNKDGICSLDVSDIIANASGNVISFAVVTDVYAATVDFEELTSIETDNPSGSTAKIPTFDAAGNVIEWNDIVISKVDGSVLHIRTGSDFGNINNHAIATEGDNTFFRTLVKKSSNTSTAGDKSGRVKLYNIFGDMNFTKNDFGKTFRITFDWRYTPQSGYEDYRPTRVSYGVMNAATFKDPVNAVNYSGTSFIRNVDVAGTDLPSEWTTVTFDYTLSDEKAIAGQYGLLTIDWAVRCSSSDAGVAGYLDIDNIKSVQITEGNHVNIPNNEDMYAKLIHTHEYVKAPSVASQVPGTTDEFYYACACGELVDDTYTHDHISSETIAPEYLMTAGTCVVKNIYRKSCSDCGMILDGSFEGDFAAHTAGPETNGAVTCTVCGDILSAATTARYTLDGTTWTYADIDAAMSAVSGKTGAIVEIIGLQTRTATITVPQDTTVTIRGAKSGDGIVRGSNFKAGIFTFNSGSNLILADILIDGNNTAVSYSGTVARIVDKSSVTINDGTIIQNGRTAASGECYGGAFRLLGGSTLTMNGGTIQNCFARAGGAISMNTGTADSHPTFIMTGGLITDCGSGKAPGGVNSDEWGNGGAVSMYEYCVMRMSGGVITNCFGGRFDEQTSTTNANDGAINIFRSSARLYLSGDATIFGNWAYFKGADSKREVPKAEAQTGASVVSADIGYADGVSTRCVVVDAGFTGLVGVRPGKASIKSFGTLEGTTDKTFFGTIVDNGTGQVALISGTNINMGASAAQLTSDGITDVLTDGFIYERFPSLPEALEKATDKTTVTVTANTTINRAVVLAGNADITLDGANYTVSRAKGFTDNALIRLDNAGTTLTVNNITLDGCADNEVTVDSKETGGTFYIADGTTVIMNDSIIRDVYMAASGSNRGAAAYIRAGGTFTMNGGMIDNCRARSGGAVYMPHFNNENTATWHPIFNLNGGIIRNCRSLSAQAQGAAVYLHKYAEMNMNGGLITGCYADRRDFGGFSVAAKQNGTSTSQTVPKAVTADGAVDFRDSTATLTLSGNAIIRGNTARNMLDDGKTTVESDIGFFNYKDSCVQIRSDFTGSVGINYPTSTIKISATNAPGATITDNAADYSGYYGNLTEYAVTCTPVADGAVSVATYIGNAENGTILGNIVANNSNKVATLKNGKLYWTTAAAETDMDGMITRYVTLDQALAAGKGTPKLLGDAAALPAGDTALVLNGYKVIPADMTLVSHVKSTETEARSYTYAGETFTLPSVTVSNVEVGEAILTGAGITAGVDLTLSIYAKLGSEVTDAKLKLVRNPDDEKPHEVLLDGVYDEESGQYLFRYKNITPQCMGDMIHMQLMTGETAVGAPITDYSVKDYLAEILSLYGGNEQYAALTTLASDLLVYGAAAQHYVSYKTDALITDGFTANENGFTPSTSTLEDKTPMTISAVVDQNTAFTAAGVEYSSVNRLYFKFKTDDLANTSVTIDGNDATIREFSEGVYIVYTEALSAREFDKIFTMVLTKGEASQTLTYSVNNYAVAISASANQKASELAKATYYYGLSAESYQ